METLILTTTPTVEGHKIIEYKGIVRGLIVRSPSFAQGIRGSFASIFGGNIDVYTKVCEQTRSEAFAKMLKHAKALKADAVVGISYDATEIEGGISEVLCYGTAVKLVKID